MKMSSTDKPIILVGAGLSGSLLAIYLARKGFHVELYERRPDMRNTNISAGKSINLALSVRGIHALKEVGLFDEIFPLLIPMRGRMIHSLNGKTTFQRYGRKDDEYINSVSRGELNKRLMNLAESYPQVKIFFNHRCIGMNFDSSEVFFRNEITGEILSRTGETVMGTDGSTSAIRLEMMKVEQFNFSQQYERHGYKELTIPPGTDGSFRIEKNALHIWPRKSYMLIALPNIDGTFTCTLFLSYESTPGFDRLTDERSVMRFFREQFSDAVPVMPTLIEDFFGNPTGTLMTIACDPWYVEDKVVLLGDACHAMVPFFGQGMNCAFEDCSTLNRIIEKHGRNWATVYREFFSARKVNADAICQMARDNFIEMRDSVADAHFLFKKEVSLALEERFPDRFIPKYCMVSFHRIPYSIALRRGIVQERILDALCNDIHSIEDLDWRTAEKLITESLTTIHEPED